MPTPKKKQKLVLLSIALLLLFSYPLISLANKPVLVNGIPLIVLYIFLGWGLVIFLAWRATLNQRKQKHE